MKRRVLDRIDAPVTPKPFAAFVVAHMAPAPPGTGTRADHCLAAVSPSSRSLLLAAHSPTTGIETPGRPRPGTGYQSGPCSGSRVSHGLRLTGHVARGCDPSDLSSYVPGSRQGIVSVGPQAHHFSGPKQEASGYPSTTDVRSSASSPVKLTGKPLRAFLWLSSLQLRPFREVPGLVRSGLAGHPAQNSPRRPRLNAPAQPACR
jgi:hypothetical protein